MVRRIVTAKTSPKKTTSAPAAPLKLTPKQQQIVNQLRRGWRVMHGRTGSSWSANGNETTSWGNMLCNPGVTSGRSIERRVLDALVKKGILQEIKRPPMAGINSIYDFMRRQDTPHESFVLTEQGKKA